MAASYPTSIVVLSTKNDGDTIFASHVDAIQDETIAVETGLLNGFQHLLKPFSDITYDLGTSALGWRDLYVSRDITLKRNLVNSSYLGVGALLVSNASKQIVEQAALTNGQVMIGSTGAAPVAAALTAGTGITITNAAGQITVASSVGGIKAYTPTIANVSNTAVETDTLNVTVGAAEMADGDLLVFEFAVAVLNNTGGAQTPTVKFKWGAVSQTIPTIGWSASATEMHYIFRIPVMRVGNDAWILDKSTQNNVSNYYAMQADMIGTETGNADVMTTPTFSSSQTVKFTVQFASASASLYWKTLAARVYKIASS